MNASVNAQESRDVIRQLMVAAQERPGAEALFLDGASYSFGDMLEQLASVERSLVKACGDALRGTRCALLCEKSSLTVYAAIVGIIKSGAVYVPLNSRFPTERNSFILADSGAEVVFYDRRSQAQLEAVLAVRTSSRALQLVAVDGEPEPGLARRYPDHRFLALGAGEPGVTAPDELAASPQDTAYILYTSGSTGQPKGVAITRGSVSDYVASVRQLLDINGQDRCTQFFDFTFDLSIHDLFVTWTAGASLYCIPRAYQFMPLKFISAHAITCWFSVPSVIATLKGLGAIRRDSLPSLRYSLFCGEALTTSLLLDWQACASNSRVFNLYGPTEATIAFTYFEARPEAATFWAQAAGVVPIGWPFPGQECVIVDDHGNEVVLGELGELCLGGSQLAREYWNNPEANERAFFAATFAGRQATRWYRTGDLARADPVLGYLYGGRRDRQVKVRGYRIELQEVEAVIKSVTGFELAAVVAYPPGAANHDGLALFVSGCVEEGAGLLCQVRPHLPDYMVPDRLQLLDVMPLNASGKVDYSALRDRLAACAQEYSPARHRQGKASVHVESAP